MTPARIRLAALALLLGFVGGFLPPPLDPYGAWFCCNSAGNCAIATTACGPDDELVWCTTVGSDASTGLSICLD